MRDRRAGAIHTHTHTGRTFCFFTAGERPEERPGETAATEQAESTRSPGQAAAVAGVIEIVRVITLTSVACATH